MAFPIDGDQAGRLVAESLLCQGPEATERVVSGARVYARKGVALGPEADAVCLIGAFDGLHVGHRALLAAAREDSRTRGVPCVAITFSPDPDEVLGQDAAGTRLLDVPSRVRGLLALGADAVVAFPFTKDLARTDGETFVERVLLSVVHPLWAHVGANFRFGYQGACDVDALARLGRAQGFGVSAHELVAAEGQSVSATRIRGLLHRGEVGEAARLLGRHHYVSGSIQHGRGEGTGFGFPTANLASDRRACMPAEGVYACYFVLGDAAWPAAVNVGAPPTFASHRDAFLEANLIGFQGDIYGEEASVVFVRWLRASRKFDSLEELERVVEGNIGWVRQNLGSGRVEVPRD